MILTIFRKHRTLYFGLDFSTHVLVPLPYSGLSWLNTLGLKFWSKVLYSWAQSLVGVQWFQDAPIFQIESRITNLTSRQYESLRHCTICIMHCTQCSTIWRQTQCIRQETVKWVYKIKAGVIWYIIHSILLYTVKSHEMLLTSYQVQTNFMHPT